jgi:hypothetical protein
MITLSIDLAKVDKSRIKTVTKKNGETAKFLNLILVENRDGVDQYGNHGFCSESVSLEERKAGTKGTILGNYVIREQKEQAPREQAPLKDVVASIEEDDDLPF